MKRFLLFLFVFIMLLSIGSANWAFAGAPSDDINVGTDILYEDITDFYYTYDASTAPPHYQRYRFYVEDGQHYFYHETREGGGWPQTEADITRSGTVELTDSQWTAFCNLLNGGVASRREEHLESGDAGPWLYIYWRGGEAEGRVLSFETAGTVFAFEEFCTALSDHPGNHTLTRFYYTIRGEMMPRSWEITLREDGYWIQENEETPRSFPEALASELIQVIADNDADSWQGVYETEYEVLDGEGFSLGMDFADGVSVQAGGDNAFPEKYFIFQHAVLDIFAREKMSVLAGTYQYEGEGFGGDFTITLNADGTYTFYEGALSSYMGSGTWQVYDNAVYLTEGEGGFDLSFMFGAEENVLVYLAAGSDAFPYVKVKDEERFMKHQTLKISVSDGTHTIVYELNDSPSAKSLYEMLPLDIEVENYGHNEKIFYPPQAVDTAEGIEGGGDAGGLALFSPWGNVVMYYDSFGAYPGLYLLGQAMEGADQVSGLSGTIHVEAVK